MGLFFRRKKKGSPGVPPPPPPEGAKEEKAEKKEEEIPELPPLKSEAHLKSDLPEIKPKEEGKKAEKMPEFPEAPEEGKKKKYEKPEEAEEAPEEAEKEGYKKEEAPGEPHEAVESIAPKVAAAGPKFVTAASFQTVLTQADSIRDSIRETEETIMRINGLKDAEEKELERWRTHIEDVEKKLNYVDKVIFRGE